MKTRDRMSPNESQLEAQARQRIFDAADALNREKMNLAASIIFCAGMGLLALAVSIHRTQIQSIEARMTSLEAKKSQQTPLPQSQPPRPTLLPGGVALPAQAEPSPNAANASTSSSTTAHGGVEK